MSRHCAELMEKQIVEGATKCGRKVTIIRRTDDLILVRIEPDTKKEWFEPFIMHLEHLQRAGDCKWSMTLKDVHS
jgi:hypothetical protein